MTLLEQSEAAMEHEAVYFHNFFFDEKLDPDVIKRYMDASRICLPVADFQSARTIEKIVSNGLDVEAVEFVLRRKKRDNFLTRKLQILFFLVEVRSQYFGYFFNCRKDRLSAVRSLLLSIIVTPYKYIKGKYLIWKYELV